MECIGAKRLAPILEEEWLQPQTWEHLLATSVAPLKCRKKTIEGVFSKPSVLQDMRQYLSAWRPCSKSFHMLLYRTTRPKPVQSGQIQPQSMSLLVSVVRRWKQCTVRHSRLCKAPTGSLAI